MSPGVGTAGNTWGWVTVFISSIASPRQPRMLFVIPLCPPSTAWVGCPKIRRLSDSDESAICAPLSRSLFNAYPQVCGLNLWISALVRFPGTAKPMSPPTTRGLVLGWLALMWAEGGRQADACDAHAHGLNGWRGQKAWVDGGRESSGLSSAVNANRATRSPSTAALACQRPLGIRLPRRMRGDWSSEGRSSKARSSTWAPSRVFKG